MTGLFNARSAIARKASDKNATSTNTHRLYTKTYPLGLQSKSRRELKRHKVRIRLTDKIKWLNKMEGGWKTF
jgi:hypothetical protein